MKIALNNTHNRKKKNAIPVINQEQIVRVALNLLDEVGFDGITMRGLAARLGIKAASLYWHVHNKQELLGLLADEICAPMREPDSNLPWQEQLEFLGNEYRNTLLLHRDAAKVIASKGVPSGPSILRLTEIILATLLNAGFSKQDAVYAGFLLNEYVTMFVLGETQYEHIDESDETKSPPLSFQDWVKSLPSNKYPAIITLADYLEKPDANERFRFGMEILKKGLEFYLLAKEK